MDNRSLRLIRNAIGVIGGAAAVLAYAMLDLGPVFDKAGDRPLPTFGYFVAASIGTTAGMLIVYAAQCFFTHKAAHRRSA